MRLLPLAVTLLGIGATAQNPSLVAGCAFTCPPASEGVGLISSLGTDPEMHSVENFARCKYITNASNVAEVDCDYYLAVSAVVAVSGP